MKELIGKLPVWALVAILIVFVPICIIVFMLLWNSTIPGITGWAEIDFVQAVAILLIGKFLSN